LTFITHSLSVFLSTTLFLHSPARRQTATTAMNRPVIDRIAEVVKWKIIVGRLGRQRLVVAGGQRRILDV
jgi:hypothetical protein